MKSKDTTKLLDHNAYIMLSDQMLWTQNYNWQHTATLYVQ